MARTLAADVSATATEFRLNAALTATHGDLYRVDDEMVSFGGYLRPSRNQSVDRTRISVVRGVEGTTAATHTAGASLLGVADGHVAGEDETKPDPFSSGAEGGGVAVLEDPGEVYPPTPTAVAEGFRISETIDGEVRVFEVIAAGTTEGTAMSDFTVNLSPLGETAESDVTWQYIGIPGDLPWTVLPPQLPEELTIGGDGQLILTSPRPPEDGEPLLLLHGTVDDAPVMVFGMQTDGDADYLFDINTSASFRFQNGDNGVGVGDGRIVQIGVNGFEVSAGAAGIFQVYYDPFQIAFFQGTAAFTIEASANQLRVGCVGLPTADPAVAGRLWMDTGAGRVLKVSAG